MAPRLGIKKQVTHAAAAGCEYNEIMNYRGTCSRCGPSESHSWVEEGRQSSAMRKRPATLILGVQMSRCLPSFLQSPPVTQRGSSVSSKCDSFVLSQPPEQKHTVGFPSKASSEVIISSPPTPPRSLSIASTQKQAVSIPTTICRRGRKRQETVETRQTPAGNRNWVASVSFALPFRRLAKTFPFRLHGTSQRCCGQF